jgi:hypothetical protein
MKAKTTTFLVTLLIAAVPLGLLWRENASLRARIAAQSLATPPPAAGEFAKSDRRRPIRVAKTEKLGAQKSVTGEIKWRSVLEDPDPVRRAGRFYTFVSNMTPESARAAAASLEDMATVGIDPAAALAWAQTIPDENMRHNTLLKMAENRASSGDHEALELLKAAGLTDREIREAKLLPVVVD